MTTVKHNLALSFRRSGEQKAQRHENACLRRARHGMAGEAEATPASGVTRP